jgi:signal peptidase I
MSVLGIAVGVTLAVALWLGWARKHWMVVTVEGNSMAPTLRHGQKVLARRVRCIAGDRQPFRRPDIVVFRLSAALIEKFGAQDLPLRVKRIAAVSGDPVPEWARLESWTCGSSDVPPNKLIVLGDNPRSQGSRELGFIDIEDIVAVVRAPMRSSS